MPIRLSAQFSQSGSKIFQNFFTFIFVACVALLQAGGLKIRELSILLLFLLFFFYLLLFIWFIGSFMVLSFFAPNSSQNLITFSLYFLSAFSQSISICYFLLFALLQTEGSLIFFLASPKQVQNLDLSNILTSLLTIYQLYLSLATETELFTGIVLLSLFIADFPQYFPLPITDLQLSFTKADRFNQFLYFYSAQYSSSGMVFLYLLSKLSICYYCFWIVDKIVLIFLLEASGYSENFILGSVCSYCCQFCIVFRMLMIDGLFIIAIIFQQSYKFVFFENIIFRSCSSRMIQKFKTLLENMKQHPKLSTALVAALAITALVRTQQHRLLYLPQIQGMPRSPSKNPFPNQQPSQYRNLSYQNLQIKTEDDIILRGWYISHQDFDSPSDRIILFYHQNAGNIGARLPFIRHLVEGTHSDVIIMGYRGYSNSEGRPSEAGLKKDGVAILNKAIQISKRKKMPLVVYGRSLGGAVAIHSCSQHQNQTQISGLILQNTFTSIYDVVLHLINLKNAKLIMKLPMFFLLSNHWQSYKKIGEITCPVFFIKSAKDELIPMEQMDRLQELCRAKKSQYVIKNGTHNETWSLELTEYFFKYKQFLGKL